ncbi:MAG TPA: bacillithiol transferase BstA [Bryobacteraceae bacterium]|nr:bacillithiol transferase BstA [Bryobacteraceae bacterium]
MSEDIRYPIGRFDWKGDVSPGDRAGHIAAIEAAPAGFRQAVAGLTESQLETPYRDGGWTVRQVIHHVADSHMNSYVRFKLALTEDDPTVKAYDEAAWARLSDSADTAVEVSLTLLDSLHRRWCALMRGMSDAEWKRTFRHPEIGPVALEKSLAGYVWHGKHHTAHIAELRRRNGW